MAILLIMVATGWVWSEHMTEERVHFPEREREFQEEKLREAEETLKSESVQIPYKIINDSLWAKLTCFPYNNIYIICYHYILVEEKRADKSKLWA